MSARARQLPAAARRRAAAVDFVVAAAIAALAYALAAGVGVVGFIALPVLLAGLLWVGLEALGRRRSGARRRLRRARSS